MSEPEEPRIKKPTFEELEKKTLGKVDEFRQHETDVVEELAQAEALLADLQKSDPESPQLENAERLVELARNNLATIRTALESFEFSHAKLREAGAVTVRKSQNN